MYFVNFYTITFKVEQSTHYITIVACKPYSDDDRIDYEDGRSTIRKWFGRLRIDDVDKRLYDVDNGIDFAAAADCRANAIACHCLELVSNLSRNM